MSDIFTNPRGSRAEVVGVALLGGFDDDVAVGPVVLVLDEVVEEAGPRLGVVVGAEVAVPDGLDQVEEHVPRVAGNAVGGGLR